MTNLNSPPPSEQNPTPATPIATQVRNLMIVSVAVVLAVLVVLGIRTETPAASLEALASRATPLEEALTNGKPSFIEFYANWCTSCQAMAGDMSELQSSYGDQVNFVMLNVDNSKWLPELLHYRVDGIPHFVYLDEAGETVAMAIGEQPQTVIASNLEALLSNAVLPYQQSVGQTSELDAPVGREPGISQRSDDPRSHGAQAIN